jgi:MoxR-like ATPase
MWRFDAVGRLADAQVKNRVQEECAYLVPQALWWAYGWSSASQWLVGINDNRRRRRKLEPPTQAPDPWRADQDRVVLLIDEIDKADPELPNALLEVLANLGFREPYGGSEVRCSEATRPLVIITTNEERQLPPAFLRRCLVHRLNLPEKDDDLVTHLTRIGEQHQLHLRPSQPCLVLKKAAQLVVRERGRLADTGLYLPGTSEFLDLITAAGRLGGPDAKRQDMLLEDLVPYTLRKSQQDR